MSKLLILLLIVGVAIFFVYHSKPAETLVKNETQDTTAAIQTSNIKIASFNIQVFGQAKSQKEDVMQVLSKTADNFDILAVQEIRDATGESIFTFLSHINNLPGNNYTVIYGPRLGRSTSKEQYAYYYNPSLVSFQSSYTYADQNDFFEREPFIARFNSSQFDFVLINIHIKPEDAYNEINALHSVIQDARSKFQDEGDFIVLGDLNADCSYLNEGLDSTLLENQEFFWVIDDSADTTTKSTVCTYDRIIFTNTTTFGDYNGKWGVFHFDKEYSLNNTFAEDISDHYPVWAEFYVNKDND